MNRYEQLALHGFEKEAANFTPEGLKKLRGNIKRQGGIAGGGAGAIGGALLGKKVKETPGALAGGVLGGIAGRQLGRNLSTRNFKEHANRFERLSRDETIPEADRIGNQQYIKSFNKEAARLSPEAQQNLKEKLRTKGSLGGAIAGTLGGSLLGSTKGLAGSLAGGAIGGIAGDRLAQNWANEKPNNARRRQMNYNYKQASSLTPEGMDRLKKQMGQGGQVLGTTAGTLGGGFLGANLLEDKIGETPAVLSGGLLGGIAGNRLGNIMGKRNAESFAPDLEQLSEDPRVSEDVRKSHQQMIQRLNKESAADPKWKQYGRRGAALGAGLGAFSGAETSLNLNSLYSNMGLDTASRGESALRGGLSGGFGGAVGGGLLGAGLGALMPKEDTNKGGQNMQKESSANPYEQLARRGFQKLAQQNPEQQKQKIAAAQIEQHYLDGLNKIAQVTGIDPETLDAKIAEVHEDNEITEEEAEQKLKEAASESPEAKATIAQIEEEEENAQLQKLIELIEDMSEEEAEELLSKIEG